MEGLLPLVVHKVFVIQRVCEGWLAHVTGGLMDCICRGRSVQTLQGDHPHWGVDRARRDDTASLPKNGSGSTAI